MNRGTINKKQYIKIVSFSKAVLWKNRELSMPKEIWDMVLRHQVIELVYIDYKKQEKWTFLMEHVKQFAKYKKEGQEEQFYFPIQLAKKEQIEALVTKRGKMRCPDCGLNLVTAVETKPGHDPRTLSVKKFKVCPDESCGFRVEVEV